ncbi:MULTISPECIES: DUF2750 domain-containing protein [unclassified Exiguobacterium]|uniref:DUF2750 domain-containing protein n=1 Tax=unclassified Exiguobacterium TaxID=2644629 RepID=UPI003336319F
MGVCTIARRRHRRLVILFVPRACARLTEWADYHVIELPVELFLERWLPNMSDDELLCGLDWSSELVELEYDPETILEYFE